MNFKTVLFFFIILFLIQACGVKGDPRSPRDATLPSVMDNYKDIDTNNQELNEYKKY